MPKKKVFLLSIAVFALAAGYYGYTEYNRKPQDLGNVKPSFTLSATDLLNAYTTDEKTANEKYLDKVVAVNGTVRSVEKNDMGYYTIILGDEGSMSSVRCSMDSVHQREAAFINSGQAVVVKGAVTGYNADELLGADVILNRCLVSK